MGDSGWAVRRRASAEWRPTDGRGTVPNLPGSSLLEVPGGACQDPKT